MYTHQFENPIYEDFYSHEGCMCYKIDLPFSKYKSYTLVLCKVEEGIDKAKRVAREAIIKSFELAMENV